MAMVVELSRLLLRIEIGTFIFILLLLKIVLSNSMTVRTVLLGCLYVQNFQQLSPKCNLYVTAYLKMHCNYTLLKIYKKRVFFIQNLQK